MASRTLHVTILLAAGFLVYLSACQAPFLGIDDAEMIATVTSSHFTLKDLLFTGASDYFRPLVVISYMANAKITSQAGGFHLVNVALHLCNGLLVYYLALSLTEVNALKERFAFLAALIFLLHPLNTEAVMWISARPDLLCTSFLLLSLILLITRQNNLSLSSLILLFLSYLLSLFAKETSIALVIIVPAYLLAGTTGISLKKKILSSASIFLAAAVYLFLRSGQSISVDQGITKVITHVAVHTPDQPSLGDAVAAYGFYLQKLVYPFPLNFTIFSFNRSIAFIALVVSVAVAFLLVHRFRALRLPLLIIFTGILPPILAYLGQLPWTPFGERYLYLPMVGFALLLSFLFIRVQRLPYIIPVSLALLLAIPTIDRVGLWSNPKAFWEEAILKTPAFFRSYVALGTVCLAEMNYDEAEKNYNKAIALGCKDPLIRKHLATIYLAKKDIKGYETEMIKAADSTSNSIAIYNALASTMLATHNQNSRSVGYAKAITYYLQAVEKNPSFVEGYYNAGKLYWVMGDTENALHYLRLFVRKGTGTDNLYMPYAAKIISKIEGKAKSAELL